MCPYVQFALLLALILSVASFAMYDTEGTQYWLHFTSIIVLILAMTMIRIMIWRNNSKVGTTKVE